MSAKLKKAWRFWRNGCIPVDYPAGSVIEDEIEIKFARDCGILEENKPEMQAESEPEQPKKRAKKRD
jgi:hypothetical protein